MEIKITKSENGYHIEDKDDGELCYENQKTLMNYLCQFLPKSTGDEIKIID